MKTLILFQFIFIAFTAVALVSLIKKQKEHVLSTRAFVFWILLWVGALGVVLLPNSTSKIAATFGVGRGVDLIIYCAIAAIFFPEETASMNFPKSSIGVRASWVHASIQWPHPIHKLWLIATVSPDASIVYFTGQALIHAWQFTHLSSSTLIT